MHHIGVGRRIGAGDGNRTRMTSLEGWDSAIELRPRNGKRLSGVPRGRLHRDLTGFLGITSGSIDGAAIALSRSREGGSMTYIVGEGGFEPPTSCSQSRCAARLRYSPGVSGPVLGFPRSDPCGLSCSLRVRIARSERTGRNYCCKSRRSQGSTRSSKCRRSRPPVRTVSQEHPRVALVKGGTDRLGIRAPSYSQMRWMEMCRP